MKLSTKNGYVFQVDDEDLSLSTEKGWCGCIHSHKRQDGKYGNVFKYIVRHSSGNGRRKNQYLHRMIVNAPKYAKVDHKNGDTLDNRRSNLRICSTAENVRNSVKISRNTSGYKGVSFLRRTSKWKVTITVNGDHKHLGYFSTREAAAMAYNVAAEKYFGEFAKLNILYKQWDFPNGSEMDYHRSTYHGA